MQPKFVLALVRSGRFKCLGFEPVIHYFCRALSIQVHGWCAMEALLIPFLSILAVVGLAAAVDPSSVVFDPIGVPPEWANRGYTSDVVSSRVTDEIRRMNETANSLKQGRGVVLGTQKTVTRELGSYLGLAAPIWIMRKEMGLIEFTISGEIVLKDKKKNTYQFLLRSSSVSTNVLTSTECGSIDRPDELIGYAAEEALRAIDPYILAAFYFDREEDAFYAARKKMEAAAVGGKATSDVETMDADDMGGTATSEMVEKEMGEQKDMDDTCGSAHERQVGPFHQTETAIKYSLEVLPRKELVWSYDLWGLVHMVKDEYDLAIEKFKLALAVDPKFEIALHNWGIALAEQGHYREAIGKYQEALAAGGTDLPGIYNAWAVALGKLGYSDEAISVFQMVMKMDPNYADAYHKLGELYETLGQMQKANGLYKRAVALDPTGEGFKEDLGRTDKMLQH